MFKSIFKKYFATVFLVILISFFVLAAVQSAVSAKYWINDKEHLFLENAKMVSDTISASARPMPGDESRYVLNMDKGSNVPMIISTVSKALEADIIVADQRGVILISSEQAEGLIGGAISSDFMSVLSSTDSLFEFDDVGGLYSRNAYVAAVPLQKMGQQVGYVLIVIPASQLFQYLGGNLTVYFISILAVLAISSIIIFAFTSHIVSPLHDMAEAAKKFGEGDFTTRLSVKGKDEIAELATSLNDMASSLSEVESVSRDFIGNISHELRTPMTTISGFVDGVLDGTIPPEKTDYYLQIVSDEVHRLSRLISAMLNMSRIDNQTLKLNPSSFDMTALIGKTLLSFEKRIEEKGIQIEGLENIDENIITGDQDLLGQVIYNLIDNAVKFTNENGTISIRPLSDANNFYFSIRNTGSSISSEEMRHIFDRFYKSDHSRSLDKTGAGLGLFIVKSVINLHHGEITVRSFEEELTEFSFWLPKDFHNNS